MLVNWETLARTKKAECAIFSVETVTRRHPERGSVSDFVVLDTPDWVNIIPLTRDKTVILIRQYRHGSDSLTLEIPGGMVNPGEDPAAAAVRECREETGYAAPGAPILLGCNLPNPAFMNNRCTSYLWPDCELSGAQDFDEHEEIQVVEMPLADIPACITRGDIRHSLVLTAFLYYAMRYPGWR